MKSSFHKTRGFTLIEMLVAMSVGLLIAITVTAVAISGLRYARTARALERLHSNAFYITDSIGNYIKQSAAFSVDTVTNKLVVSLPDLTSRTISRSGTQICVDTTTPPVCSGQIITSSDVQVTSFNVISATNSVRISFTLQAVSTGNTFSAVTTLARRNSF